MKLRSIILLVTLIVMLPLSSAGASDIDSWGSSRAGIYVDKNDSPSAADSRAAREDI